MASPPLSNTQKILERISKEYAERFSDIHIQPERQKILSQLSGGLHTIEQQNKLLEETVKSSRAVTEMQLPKIHSHNQALQHQFRCLDLLSALVQRVTSDVARLEAAVTVAEQQLLGEQPTLTHRILQPVIKKLDPVITNGSCQKPAYDPTLLFDPAKYLKNYENNIPGTSPESFNNITQQSPHLSSSAANSCPSQDQDQDVHTYQFEQKQNLDVEEATEADCLDGISNMSVQTNMSSATAFRNTFALPYDDDSHQVLLDDEELNIS